MQHKTVTESEVAATTHTSSRFRDAMRRFRVSHMLQHFHVNNQKVRGDAQSDKLSLRRVKSGVIVSSPSEDPSVCNHTQVSINFYYTFRRIVLKKTPLAFCKNLFFILTTKRIQRYE